MNDVKIIKLDARYRGSLYWRYCVNRPLLIKNNTSKTLFLQWRVWCWDNWGPSKELSEYDHTDLFDGINCSNPRWCWQNDQYSSRIYFKSDREVIDFSLFWL